MRRIWISLDIFGYCIGSAVFYCLSCLCRTPGKVFLMIFIENIDRLVERSGLRRPCLPSAPLRVVSLVAFYLSPFGGRVSILCGPCGAIMSSPLIYYC